jgi:hypothetical protein
MTLNGAWYRRSLSCTGRFQRVIHWNECGFEPVPADVIESSRDRDRPAPGSGWRRFFLDSVLKGCAVTRRESAAGPVTDFFSSVLGPKGECT